MTDYFEVLGRDGAAREGELRLADPVATPAVVAEADRGREDSGAGAGDGTGGVDATRDPPGVGPAGTGPHPVVVDAGSLWTAERARPEGDPARLTVLPHRSFPAGTREEVATAFAPDYPDVEYPSAAVVSADTAADYGADAYVLSDLPGAVGHAAAFVERVVAAREAVPPDAALYAAGVATPGNLPTLVYAGVDLVDASRARALGRRGRYLTGEAELFLEDLDALPCACPACRGGVEGFDRGDCAAHNVAALCAELLTVRRRLREGRLRDYLEGQARHEAWHAAALRELDGRDGYLEPRAPVVRKAELLAATDDSLRRAEIRRFADRVTGRYRNRFANPLVVLPCSAQKPYGESQSHRQFREAIDYRGHVVSMTSPIGVVPQELELTYPAQHYDAVVTGRWSATERAFVGDVLRRYLRRNDYPRVIAHVPEGGYRDVVAEAAADLGLDPVYTVADHPTTEASLANLRAALEGELKYSRREREHNTVRAMADYMLGDGAGDDLFPDPRVEGRYPKLRVTDADGQQLAAMVPEYGVLAFTLAGARRWVESDAPVKRVGIDGFVPHGSVLAPGVTAADEGVRVGDEVVVEGPEAFAVGRARMFGREMADSTRGVAVQVRHVEEK